STNAVYTALNPANPNDTTVPCTGTGTYNQYFSSAKGPYAGAGGAIDLTGANVVPGAYRLEASFVKSSGCSSFVAQNFYIPLPWDISVSKIIAPATNASPQFYKYPRGVPIAISCRVQNVGQNTVNALRIIDEIRDQNGTLLRMDTLVYNNAVGLATGQEVGSDAVAGGFPNFTTTTTGVYCVTFRTELIGVTDQQLSNNVQPSAGCYSFEVQYDIELSAESFLNPTASSSLFVGRPIRPAVRIRNNGLADASDIPATLIIKKDGQVVYNASISIPDCSRGLTTGATFPFWTPNAVGSYQLCFYTSLTEDAIKTNDTLCMYVNVGDALNGTYTIGTLNQGGARNFTTISDAVNALYGAGVSGPTIFELTDASYTVGSGANGFPAVDMTSRVAGASATNSITFRPSLLQSLTRSSISIRLRSGNGVGFLFGQNYFPTNANAIQNSQPLASNANPVGYVTFDGGSQKSFRFMLDVGTATPSQLPHRAVFYLGNGASNISIKNCLIENFPQSTASYASALPVVRYLAPNFTFESDVRQLASGPESYAAGIVARSVAPSNQGNNSLGLDTLTNNNNQFVNNDISGFGYGIVSLGVGPLFYNDLSVNGNPRFQRYYNKGTVISGNIISSVRRAGIFVGYGENDVISNNRILNVGIAATGTSGQAAGIMVGGEARPNQLCYNNIKPSITKNEVSNVSSDIGAQGIYVEQTVNSFVNPAGGNVTF
ncbi:MAG: right-handed parallel beta-helix repeat-containing protein, partial [Candidatus Kapaibacterium sp.]